MGNNINDTYYGAVNDYRGYLMHYGVKGMHWGVRRYQNTDGSLTSMGRQHYGYSGQSKIHNKKAGGADPKVQIRNKLVNKAKSEIHSLYNRYHETPLYDIKPSNDIKQMIKNSISEDQKDKLRKAIKQRDEAFNYENDEEFEDSKEYDKLLKEAHEVTISDLKRYGEYDKLLKWAKENDSDITLTKLYDRIFEYNIYESKLRNKYEKEFKKSHPNYRDVDEMWSKANNKVHTISKEIMKDILGDRYTDIRIDDHFAMHKATDEEKLNAWLSNIYIDLQDMV